MITAFLAAVLLASLPLAASAQVADIQAAQIRRAASDFVNNRFVTSCNEFGALYVQTKHFHTLDPTVIRAFRVNATQNGDSFAQDTKSVLATKNYPEACTLSYVTALAYLHEGKIQSADRLSASAAQLQQLVARRGMKDRS